MILQFNLKWSLKQLFLQCRQKKLFRGKGRKFRMSKKSCLFFLRKPFFFNIGGWPGQTTPTDSFTGSRLVQSSSLFRSKKSQKIQSSQSYSSFNMVFFKYFFFKYYFLSVFFIFLSIFEYGNLFMLSFSLFAKIFKWNLTRYIFVALRFADIYIYISKRLKNCDN